MHQPLPTTHLLVISKRWQIIIHWMLDACFAQVLGDFIEREIPRTQIQIAVANIIEAKTPRYMRIEYEQS